nr:hydroxymethylbilane synthase [Auraticoccus cholistanensis]
MRVGARTSPLARTQADWVAARIEARGVPCEFVGVVTTGDVDQRALTQIGGTGLFVGAVRSGLVRRTIDVAVHSLKDLPTGAEPGLRIAAMPEREDVRDVLVGSTLDALGDGARVGTGSPRRAVQLQAWAHRQGIDLQVVPVRGNVDTRIGHVGSGALDATVLAAAGLRRLGRLVAEGPDGRCRVVSAGEGGTPEDGVVAQLVPTDVLLPAAGQGALAVEVAEDNELPELSAVDALDDPATRARVTAERTFLARLEAGCLAPVGVLASLHASPPSGTGDSQAQDLTLDAVIGRTIGSDVAHPAVPELLQVSLTGAVSQARQLGTELAEQALSRLGHDLRR